MFNAEKRKTLVVQRTTYVKNFQTRRISVRQRIPADIPVRIQPATETDGIGLQVPSGRRVIGSKVVVVFPGST